MQTAPLHLDWAEGDERTLPQVAALALAAFDPEFGEAWSVSQMAAMLRDAGSWLDLAWADGRLCAFALNRMVADEAELLLCATDVRQQRLGVGRALVLRVAERARARGARRLFLEVREGNQPANALYAACGFLAVGRRPGYYRSASGSTVDAITLALRLN
jgi:ribosomal-protein-alanine N-acetyltransferase